MSDARTQKNRLIAIKVALDGIGEDDILLRGFHMTEELGRPFTCELDLRSELSELPLADLLGANCTIRVFLTSGETRYINGFLSRIVQEGTPSEGRANQYRATLVPWLWFLTRTSNCRIYKGTIPEIIAEVFRAMNFTDFVDELNQTYKPRDFVVQYRETAFNFITRLMEDAGIYYYFRHENGKHTLVLCDSPSAHSPVAGYEEIPYIQQTSGTAGQERVSDWVQEQQIQPGEFVGGGFDFTGPKVNHVSREVELDGTIAERKPITIPCQVYDYPLVFSSTDAEVLETSCRIRAEEFSAQTQLFRARGDTRGLTVGSTFKLKWFPLEKQNAEYLVIGMSCHAETDEYSSGGGGGSELYQCGFTAIPVACPFRLPRSTPRPVIAGPQTAIVTGTKGEEIHTNEHGCVRVRFHWDRSENEYEATSYWIRVAQIWAGKSWGAMFLPRVGQEVIVEFLEGDPDAPIVTGRVYNGQCAPPYKLPDNKTMSTIKSSSSKGGDGFNEIRFEDMAGSEQLFIHAQKNMDIRVKADRFETIGHDRHLVVENHKFEHIKVNRNEQVDGTHKELIKGDRNVTVNGKEAVAIDGSKSLKVKGDVIENFLSNQATVVTGEVHIKADTIILEATTNITVKVGDSNYLAIDKSSLDLASKDITAKASGALKTEGNQATHKAASSMTVEGATTTLKGSSAVTISGGSVSIN